MPKSQDPGTVLQNEMDLYQLSPAVLGDALSLTPAVIKKLLANSTPISVDIALRLARYFGKTADYWLGLQCKYAMAINGADIKAIKKAKKPRTAGAARSTRTTRGPGRTRKAAADTDAAEPKPRTRRSRKTAEAAADKPKRVVRRPRKPKVVETEITETLVTESSDDTSTHEWL